MKSNFKNMVVTGILTSVFMVGATTAHAGLLISDRPTSGETPTCPTQTEDSDAGFISELTDAVAKALAGLLITDRSGLMISDRSGLLISDKPGETPCKE